MLSSGHIRTSVMNVFAPKSQTACRRDLPQDQALRQQQTDVQLKDAAYLQRCLLELRGSSGATQSSEPAQGCAAVTSDNRYSVAKHSRPLIPADVMAISLQHSNDIARFCSGLCLLRDRLTTELTRS